MLFKKLLPHCGETIVSEHVISEKEALANDLVAYYSKWAMGAGTIPFPLIDFAVVTGVQIQMLSKLSDLYGIPFSENSVKSMLVSFLGGLFPAKVGWGAGYAVGSTLKSFPVIGSLIGIGTAAVVAGATTFAIGKVFVRHFENGGTFLTFDSVKAKAYFQEQYQRGTDVIKGAKRQKGAPQAQPEGIEAAHA